MVERWLTAVAFLIPFSFQTAFAENTRVVTWSPNGEESALLLSQIMASSNEAAKNVSCYFTVERPRMGFPSLTSQKNVARCFGDTLSGDYYEVKWPLASSEIYAWGNRFSPKGFSLKGQDAENLYRAMQRKARYREMERLRFEHVVLSSPAIVMDTDEWKFLDDDPENADGYRVPLVCTRYYFYKPDEQRPAAPSETRCDFIYQWKAIEGDLF